LDVPVPDVRADNDRLPGGPDGLLVLPEPRCGHAANALGPVVVGGEGAGPTGGQQGLGPVSGVDLSKGEHAPGMDLIGVASEHTLQQRDRLAVSMEIPQGLSAGDLLGGVVHRAAHRPGPERDCDREARFACSPLLGPIQAVFRPREAPHRRAR